MSAFAPVTLDDAASLAVVFNPSSIDSNGVARWFEDGVDIIDARRQISLSVRLPSKGSQVARVTMKVVTPIMDSVDTSKKVADVLANIEFVVPKSAAGTKRADILAFAANLLADAAIVSAVNDLESIY